MNRPAVVRVGIALQRDVAREWHRQAVSHLRGVVGARVALALVSEDATTTPVHGSADRGLARVPLDRVVAGTPTSSLDATTSRPAALDVIVDFTESRRLRSFDDGPRFGVWRYGFGDGRPSADGAPGTLVRLYRSTQNRDVGGVLCEGWYRAATADGPGTESVSLRVAAWSARVLRQICAGDVDIVDAPPQSIADTPEAVPGTESRPWIVTVANAVNRWMRRERWTIGVVPIGIEEILDRGQLPEPAWLVGQPADRFYADPFVLERAGDRMRLLVEDYRYRDKRGRVTELQIGVDGRLLRARDRLALPRHASYPFVLRDRRRLLCIPETARSGRLSAFGYDPDSDAWRFDRALIDGFAAVDATVVRHDGLWWLFCTNRDDENQTDLHLFSAPEWSGPWTPHPMNPVKSDARSSRPAGACFEIGGTLYRPAQDCAPRYGAAIAINRVTELSPRRFREETVATLRPSSTSPWPDGRHTINTFDGITVVDGLRVERARAPVRDRRRAGAHRHRSVGAAALPTVYWINLERAADRRTRMLERFETRAIAHVRVEAVDGSDSATLTRIVTSHARTIADAGCIASHLSAIALAHARGEEMAIVMEDDTTFDLYDAWPRGYAEILAALPPDWSAVALCALEHPRHLDRLYRRAGLVHPLGKRSYWSLNAYLIHRRGMTVLLDRYARDGGFDVTAFHGHYPDAYHLVMRTLQHASVPGPFVARIPLFGIEGEDSYIHPEELDEHRAARDFVHTHHRALVLDEYRSPFGPGAAIRRWGARLRGVRA